MGKRTRYVAKYKGKFACAGMIFGAGTIEMTPDVMRAYSAESPAGLMLWMGGHYRGYTAHPVTVETVVGKVVPWPNPEKVFDD